MQLQLQLANETWKSVYIDNGTNSKFNSFLHTFLNVFEGSFPVKYKHIHRKKNGRITQRIKIRISCEHKSRPYTNSRNSNGAVIKAFYIKYCKILNKVIQEATKQHCNSLIAKSDKKVKTTWNVMKQETEGKYT
jgi:ribosomal protein L33